MKHSTVVRAGSRLLAVVAVVAVAAGCGASTDAVLDALPASTTAAPTTTQAPSTTESPTTTEPTSTTEAPSTTSSGGGSDDMMAEAKDAFMEQCEMGQPAGTCQCIWDAIEGDLDIEGMIDAGTSGTLPPETEQKIIDATMECILEADS